ncbi:MAG: DUF3800 domain-containing protein [Planctomycetes bacterium]|nr:DUF3800 domain-containing protein [Planctomycetota bacterium]
MSVRFFYVDESHDKDKFCISAIAIRHSHWHDCFKQVRAHRERLKEDYGIFLRKEIHAYKFLGGRGRIAPNTITKWQRSRIYNGLLELVASLPHVMIFNVCLDKADHSDPHMVAWDRLINRIERTLLEMERMELPKRKQVLGRARQKMAPDDVEFFERCILDYKARAFIISDQGRELEIERALRKMHVFNPIPSRFGAWNTGSKTKSITVDHIVEDPVFKKSERSYFIQLADCVVHALLKRETPPTSRVLKYGIDKMFDNNLQGVCYKRASQSDPLGIVRQ